MKTAWSHIPISEVNRPLKEKVSGISVESMAAYFDVPTAWRFSFDEKSGDLSVEFKYPTDEEALKSLELGKVSLLVGKNTNRIYLIRFDNSLLPSAINKSEFSHVVVSDADHWIKKHHNDFKGLNVRNSKVVETVFDWSSQKGHLNLVPAN